MSKRIYEQGKQINSVAEFENTTCDWFIIRFGDKYRTRHRGFLISWQYRVLKGFIDAGRVYEAARIVNEVKE